MEPISESFRMSADQQSCQMHEIHRLAPDRQPVVIGGVGGSGTRLIAQCLIELDYMMGHNLNQSNDNLWFTLLFKNSDVLSCSDEKFDELLELLMAATTKPSWLARTLMTLLNKNSLVDRPNAYKRLLRCGAKYLIYPKHHIQEVSKWGWKEPNSHIVIDRLIPRFPNMKYIQVVRNGMDMAYSRNQNQLKLWGRHFITEPYEISPRSSLKYWCAVHKRVLANSTTMGRNFLLLNYDKFCLNPDEGVAQLCDFLGDTCSTQKRALLVRLVNPPDSIGRFRLHCNDSFDEQDIAYVRELGFDVGDREAELTGELLNSKADRCKV